MTQMTPADLPKFTVTAAGTDFYVGRFDSSPWVKEDGIAGVYDQGPRFVWGRFRQVNSGDSTCSFYPDEAGGSCPLQPGTSYPYIDGYWGERAELVLDQSRTWTETAFAPSDMVLFYPDQGGRLGTRSSPNAPAGGDVVPGGWDHEHCAICWRTIGCGGEPRGYFGDPDTWICGECYAKHVRAQSIAFAGMDKEWFLKDGTWRSRK
jgi:hypothetical protein